MTNTLTRRFNFLTLPKLNTNLFSVISLIVLCLIVFVTINTATEACDDLLRAYHAADLIADGLSWVAQQAIEALQLAEKTGIDFLIKAATAAAEAALAAAGEADNIVTSLLEAYLDCLKKSQPKTRMVSGSCDSGSCDNGS